MPIKGGCRPKWIEDTSDPPNRVDESKLRGAGRRLSDFPMVSEWIDDAELRDLVQLAQPALLVTQRGDEAYVERFARVTGMAVEPARLVQRHGEIEVYELIRALPRQ